MHGYRKFSVMVLVVLGAIGLRISGHIESAQIVDLFKIIVPAFLATNLISKFTPKGDQ